MFKERYNRCKKDLLTDTSINSSNRKIIKKFLEWEEYKLKRRQGLSDEDVKLLQ